MPYQTLANARAPALIIYLLDVSVSMKLPLDGRSRISFVSEALEAALQQMVFRSTKGGRITPRYRIAIYAYSDDVYDILGGIKSIEQVARLGVPQLSTLRTTDTARAFAQAEQVLKAQLPYLRNCPSPLVCHMTDGEFTGEDPEPIVRRIMQMRTADGPVLVENILLSDEAPSPKGPNATAWSGVRPETPLQSAYARKLRSLSSPLPDSYREVLEEHNYRLSHGALMLLPGTSPSLVSLGFQMSAATPVQERLSG